MDVKAEGAGLFDNPTIREAFEKVKADWRRKGEEEALQESQEAVLVRVFLSRYEVMRITEMDLDLLGTELEKFKIWVLTAYEPNPEHDLMFDKIADDGVGAL